MTRLVNTLGDFNHGDPPPKPFLLKVKHFFGMFTVEEQYQRGKACVDAEMAKCSNQEFTACYLYAVSNGSFNENDRDSAYDRGVHARLHELGFECPY